MSDILQPGGSMPSPEPQWADAAREGWSPLLGIHLAEKLKARYTDLDTNRDGVVSDIELNSALKSSAYSQSEKRLLQVAVNNIDTIGSVEARDRDGATVFKAFRQKDLDILREVSSATDLGALAQEKASKQHLSRLAMSIMTGGALAGTATYLLSNSIRVGTAKIGLSYLAEPGNLKSMVQEVIPIGISLARRFPVATAIVSATAAVGASYGVCQWLKSRDVQSYQDMYQLKADQYARWK